MIVLTSFFWGIFIFEERVKSKLGACCACCTLILGLFGMSTFSRPPSAKRKDVDEDVKSKVKHVHSAEDLKVAIGNKIDLKKPISKRNAKKVKTDAVTIIDKESPSSLPLTSLEMESLVERKESFRHSTTTDMTMKRIPLCGGHITKRQLGILAAIFNGLWGGTNLIPLHYAAHNGYGGPSYVISFASGSMIITGVCWVMRLLFELYQLDGAIAKAYHALPSFYVRQIGFPCFLSGVRQIGFYCFLSGERKTSLHVSAKRFVLLPSQLLYSGGNFGCIIAG